MHEWLSGGVSPCQGEGRGFESRLVLSEIQWCFQGIYLNTRSCTSGSVVEYRLAKARVAGSNPVSCFSKKVRKHWKISVSVFFVFRGDYTQKYNPSVQHAPFAKSRFQRSFAADAALFAHKRALPQWKPIDENSCKHDFYPCVFHWLNYLFKIFP